MVEGLLKVA
jgi:hypothetical protein